MEKVSFLTIVLSIKALLFYVKINNKESCSYGPSKDIRSVKRFLKAGPRKHLYFNPSQVKVAIVTCGGLCPGLNNVIRELVNCLALTYGVKDIYGIKYGYKGNLKRKGFYSYEWI